VDNGGVVGNSVVSDGVGNSVAESVVDKGGVVSNGVVGNSRKFGELEKGGTCAN